MRKLVFGILQWYILMVFLLHVYKYICTDTLKIYHTNRFNYKL
jgi:hypothetical protein